MQQSPVSPPFNMHNVVQYWHWVVGMFVWEF